MSFMTALCLCLRWKISLQQCAVSTNCRVDYSVKPLIDKDLDMFDFAWISVFWHSPPHLSWFGTISYECGGYCFPSDCGATRSSVSCPVTLGHWTGEVWIWGTKHAISQQHALPPAWLSSVSECLQLKWLVLFKFTFLNVKLVFAVQ